MKNRHRFLFDYQRFANNERLGALIAKTENRYHNAVSDDDLEIVSAAGETAISEKRLSNKGDDEND